MRERKTKLNRMEEDYNIIVIISDTFRQDHLGCYGNNEIVTPNLDEFSEKYVTFDNFYSASFPTMPNRADLYTGKHTFTYLGWSPLPRKETILPEIMSEEGYETIGIVDTPFYLRDGNHYDRGFDNMVEIHGQLGWGGRNFATYDWNYEDDRFAPRTFKTARRWLEQNYDDSPFFMLVDTWDPHEPWDPPRWYTEIYRPDYDVEKISPTYSRDFDEDFDEKDAEKAHDCYCGEITMVDEHFGRFMSTLEKNGTSRRYYCSLYIRSRLLLWRTRNIWKNVDGKKWRQNRRL